MKRINVHTLIRTNRPEYDPETFDLVETLQDVNAITPNALNKRLSHVMGHHPELRDDLIRRTSFLPEDATWQERILCVVENYGERPKCKACDQPVHFNRSAGRFNHYCNSSCSSRKR